MLFRSNIGAAPVAGFTYTLNGGQLTLTNTSQNATTFDWNFGDGSTSTQAQPSHVYTNPGAYTITLVVANACGDFDTVTQTINVLGIVELQDLGINVFPNPSTGKITITGLSAFISKEIELIDLTGRELGRVKIENNIQQTEFSSVANGLYLIRIENGTLPLRIQR